jgi:hypothetical protein
VELHNLCSFPDDINDDQIKDDEVGREFSTHWYKNLKGRYRYNLGVDGRILKWISNKQDATVCTGFIWLRIGTRGGPW